MPRGATSAWSGAINFGGFPISLRAYNLIQSRSAQSFKSLCPCHQQPITMPKRCPVDEHPLDVSELLKGHEVSKGNIVVIPPEAAEQIKNAEATKVLEIKGLPPLDSVPVGLATAHFRLVPDEKVPGSDQPANVLWNGLLASKRALVTEWIPRAGSRDSLLAIEASLLGLTGHQLPWRSELKDVPEFTPEVNEKAASMFEAFAQTAGIEMGEFAHVTFESAYEQRRQQAIEAALSGQPIPVGATPAQAGPAPDLMALMSAAVEEAKATRKPAKAKGKTKVKEAA